MLNDWEGFRHRLEADGYLYEATEAQKIARVAVENEQRWQHFKRLVRMIQKKNASFLANKSLDAELILDELLLLIPQKNPVLYQLDELLTLLCELDQRQGDFDFIAGSTADYVKRVKLVLKISTTEFAWRVGETRESFEPPYRIGMPANIPRKKTES